MTATPTTTVLDRPTLLRLRWGGVAALTVVLGAGAMGWVPAPPPGIAFAVLGSAILLNLLLQKLGPHLTGPVLIGDTFVLTWMLASGGGVANPFTLLYLFPVVLAAMVLRPVWSAVLVVVTTAAFAGLYLASPGHHHMDMSTHLVGMVAAYALTVPLLAAAVHRFRTAASAAELEATRSRQSLAAAERLAGLAALAGGAAHELATPMSTVLLIARELERKSEGETKADLAAIGAEVETCREILNQLAIDSGQGLGEVFEPVQLDLFLQAATGGDARVEAGTETASLPPRLIGQAIRRLVGNARQATGPEGAITVRGRSDAGIIRFEVEDDGPGMSDEVRARACEPFFTTKPHGQGHGLGLFFVHSLAHQLDGDLLLESGPGGRGTLAILTFPGGP